MALPRRALSMTTVARAHTVLPNIPPIHSVYVHSVGVPRKPRLACVCIVKQKPDPLVLDKRGPTTELGASLEHPMRHVAWSPMVLRVPT